MNEMMNRLRGLARQAMEDDRRLSLEGSAAPDPLPELPPGSAEVRRVDPPQADDSTDSGASMESLLDRLDRGLSRRAEEERYTL